MLGLIHWRPRYFRVIATGLIFLINIKSSYAGCADTLIGVENKYIIPDSSFTATSTFAAAQYYQPHFARLYSTFESGWGPSRSKLDDPNQYLQIDLGLPYVICAVATQGRTQGGAWVTQYKINVSMDNTNWTPYYENGTLKLFAGNTDHSTIKKNTLNQPLVRYIRFIPTMYYSWKTMRAGIYGYLKGCENLPLGMESGTIQDSRITVSSPQQFTKNTARLHYTSGSSWCASTGDFDPYLQIDLGSSHLICGVATQGDSMADQWVRTYQIDTSTDGTTWTTYQEDNTDRIFYGNYDRSTVVRQVLYNGVLTRYLRIVPKTYQTNTPCLRTEIYGFQTSCSSHSVGIPSNSLVPDHRFTATSTSIWGNRKPRKGRLGSDTCWAAGTRDNHDDYLQVDLGAVFFVCAVATQGAGENFREWVTKYEVLYSTNNIQWKTYSTGSGEKEFNGNSDRTTAVTNAITNPFRARFVRVRPTEVYGYKMLRVDFKGFPLGCTLSLGLENSNIPDSQITSSSFWTADNGDEHLAIKGRLYGSLCWCSGTNVNTEYIQVDLGQVKTVTGIATQGHPSFDAWVTSYKMEYSFEDTHWNEYREGQIVKILDGNTNRNDVRVNWLRNPIAARYVRIYPQTHNSGGRQCLRFDLYGCDIFVAPKVVLNTADLIVPSIKGSSRTLTCSVLGEPAPDIQWFNNGTKINGATQSTLQVQFISAEDVVSKYNCTRQDPNTRVVVCNTFYTCRATYPSYVPSGGMKESEKAKVTLFLNVSKAPGLTLATLNKTTITLRWAAITPSDDTGTITSYNIRLYNQSGSIGTYYAHGSAVNYTFKHLDPYTNYSIKMNAVSTVGQGLWSSWLHVRTLIAEPEGVPSITEANVLTSQSIQLFFQYSQSSLLHGPMAGFRIFYEAEHGSRQYVDVRNVNKTTLTDLKKYTEYRLSVAVRNTMYTGPASGLTRRRTLEDVPDAGPQNASSKKLNDTTFLVTWQPLTSDQSNGIVIKYEIFWSLDLEERRSRRSLQEMLNATTQATQYTLYNLRVCTNYTVSIRGHTRVGPGPKSTINIFTLSEEPGKPTNVRTANPSKTSIEVIWEKPSPISMVIYEYLIEVKGSKEYWQRFSFSNTYTQTGARTNMVIEGLVPGTSYEFWVTASTACSKSQKSASSKRNTRIDNPIKPEGKSVRLKDKFNIPLWSVDPINGRVSSYQVIVIKGNKSASDLPANISDYKDGKELYVTAELKRNEFKSSFPIGDNEKYGKYKNVPLDKGTYTIAERAITEDNGNIYTGQAAVVATIEVTQDPTEFWEKEGDETCAIIPYVIPLALINLGLVICIVYLVFRLRKERKHNEKCTKTKKDETDITNDGMDNSRYEDDVNKSPKRPKTAKAEEIENPGYMELQPRQSRDPIYQPIQKLAKNEAPYKPFMTEHEQYMDLYPQRVNTEYETLRHKENLRQDYEEVSQSVRRKNNQAFDATEA